MSGSNRTKRSMAPAFWRISRKRYPFVVTTIPGPHPRAMSYPFAVLIRDILKLTKTYRETKVVIKEGKILVDGVVRRDPHFPVGLMDVVDIPSIEKSFRIVPLRNFPLHPIEIPSSERSLKLCKVKSKTMEKGGLMQFGFHDGRSLLFEEPPDLSCWDSCLIQVPSQELVDKLKLEPKVIAIVTGGSRVGEVGRVKELVEGSFFTLPMVKMELDGSMVELPKRYVLAVGRTDPLITIRPATS